MRCQIGPSVSWQQGSRRSSVEAAANVPTVDPAAPLSAWLPHSPLGAQQLAASAHGQMTRFWALSGKFMPMAGLFFLLAFVNTILDSLKVRAATCQTTATSASTRYA